MTAIDDCPDIADGEGSVVTGRFITRQANDLARVTVARLPPTVQEILSRNALASDTLDLLADLEQLARLGLVDIETLEGTQRHPVWSEDQQDWMPLGQLQPSQTLRAAGGPAVVLSVTIHNHPISHYQNLGRGFLQNWTVQSQQILKNAGIGVRSAWYVCHTPTVINLQHDD
ncbi:MAG: hypothetical protein KF752_05280 [Pirellulaceae bacterium]|nr:hypothetical protein [Pirellulaceae bacterium]